MKTKDTAAQRTSAAGAALKWIPYRPSNGTEGGIFEEAFCDRCKRDSDNTCRIHTAALAFKVGEQEYPKEWVIPEDAAEWPGDAKCNAFECAND